MTEANAVSLGIFDYINVWPVYYQFLFESHTRLQSNYRLVYGEPSRLNQLFATGNLAVTCLSSSQGARLPENARLLPSVCLSTLGSVESVVLISKRPIEDLKERTIFTTTSSCTSTLLLQTILHHKQISAQLVSSNTPMLESEKSGTAALLIGDEALRARFTSPDSFRYDLGQLWLGLTGKPFVWALWGVRDLSFQNQNTVSDALVQSCRRGLTQLSQLAEKAAARLNIDTQALLRYFQNLNYTLTEERLAGLHLFYRMAHDLGLLPECKTLPFISEEVVH